MKTSEMISFLKCNTLVSLRELFGIRQTVVYRTVSTKHQFINKSNSKVSLQYTQLQTLLFALTVKFHTADP